MATRPDATPELKIDPATLYLEEIFTDRKVGTIRRMTPVGKDGQRDNARPILYVGETQVLTPAGALPIGFEIQAGSLEDAAEKFGPLAISRFTWSAGIRSARGGPIGASGRKSMIATRPPALREARSLRK